MVTGIPINAQEIGASTGPGTIPVVVLAGLSMTHFIDRAHRARSPVSGLAYLAASLMGIAVLCQPSLASAAGRKAGGDTALSAVRGPSFVRRELPEPGLSAGGPVVLRGTRPTRPNAGQPRQGEAGEGYTAPGNEAFQPGPLCGSGWDAEYDFSGLNGTYFPAPQ
jgi:hypothetical protein